MTKAVIQGKAYYCGDYVDTDVISPGRFEPYGGVEHLAEIALIDYPSDIPFVKKGTKRSSYTVIFAGHEFGCGSSREAAPLALYHAGARVIIAKSFARIFFRNCVNMGLLFPIRHEHPFDHKIIGEDVFVDINKNKYFIRGKEFTFETFGPINSIIEAGGLINYTKKKLRMNV